MVESDFVSGLNLLYLDGSGNSQIIVYEGVTSDGLHHLVRTKEGKTIHTPEAYMDQPNLSNIPKTPQDYCNEVGIGLTFKEVQELVYPCVLMPTQQELMSRHHRLYHLLFWRLFQLAMMGVLPKYLLECREHPPLCIECQFGQAHRQPWCTKGKGSGIRQNEHKEPGDGTSSTRSFLHSQA